MDMHPLFENSLKELKIYSELRNPLDNHWGPVSIPTDPKSISKLQSSIQYMENAIPYTFRNEDVFVMINPTTNSATAYSVNKDIFDVLWTMCHTLPVAKIKLKHGRQLTEQQYQAPNFEHHYFTVDPNLTYVLQTNEFDTKRNNARTAYMAPLIPCSIKCPTQYKNLKNHSFLTTSFIIDFVFEIENDLDLLQTDITITLDKINCLKLSLKNM